MSRSLKRKNVSEENELNKHPSKRKHEAHEEGVIEEDELMDSGNDDAEFSEGSEDSEANGKDEWGGLDIADGAGTSGGASSTAPNGKKKKEKLPTGEELRAIKEGADLFKSNSFKLQIDALLSNVRPKETHLPPLERFLHALHTHLTALPSIPPRAPLEAAASLLEEGVAVPYPQPPPTEAANWKVAFHAPSEITLVGSWANKVSVRGKRHDVRWTVDLALEMPTELFQEKDYLDGRFFHKKAYYLACLASGIGESKELNVDIHYDSANADTRQTCLLLRPRKDDSPRDFTKLKAQVRLIPVLPTPPPISTHHLSPSHCNIRIKNSSSPPSSTPPSTPLYNTALLLTTTPRAHLLRTHTLTYTVPAFRDALALLRVWATQRAFCAATPGDARGAVLGFAGRGAFWAQLLGSLVLGEEPVGDASKKGAGSRRTVGRGLSSYQLFKAALTFLADHDFGKDAVFAKSKNGHRFPPEDYIAHHESVFVDSSSTVNLVAGIPRTSLDLLRHDARVTLETLDEEDAAVDPFETVFLKDQTDLQTRFDVVLRVDLSSAQPRDPSLLSVVDHGSLEAYTLAQVSSLLRRALGDRVHAIGILVNTSSTRSLASAHAPLSLSDIRIGLILNTANAFRLVDHGPPAAEHETPEIAAFRALWGPKAELRRFKDGRIAESVVWDVLTSDERAHIPAAVVAHVLSHHFGLPEAHVQGHQAGFDALLRLPAHIAATIARPGAQLGTKGAQAAFASLVRALKALADDDSLPLSLLSVSPTSPALRHTAPFAPLPLPPPVLRALPPPARHVAPLAAVLQFERSARWPDDPAAIQSTKLAFFERIASALMAREPGLHAAVVLGDADTGGIPPPDDIADRASLQVLTPDGWAFSLRIHHEREGVLLAQLARPPSTPAEKALAAHTPSAAQRHRAASALALHTRRFVHAPRHHRVIAALAHRWPAFAGTVRLATRWLAAHWVLGPRHVRPEAVELLCAAVFVGARALGAGAGTGSSTADGSATAATPLPNAEELPRVNAPGSKEAGFARVVALLRDWAWDALGLFVRLGDATPDADAAQAAVVQAGARAGVWRLATGADPTGHAWTAQGPSGLVARRVRALAGATAGALRGLCDGAGGVPKALFVHPTEDYDVLIQLDPGALTRYHQNIAADEAFLTHGRKYANLPQDTEDEDILVDFDPAASFVADLQRIYAGTLEFFHDVYGGATIGGVWDPSLAAPRRFRVMGGFTSVPVPVADEENAKGKSKQKGKDRDMVLLNHEAVLAEIQRLGDGLVKTIEVRRVPGAG